MLGVNAPSLIFYQQQEILILHFTYTDHSLKMILAVLDGETFQDQTFLASYMTFFHWAMIITINAKTFWTSRNSVPQKYLVLNSYHYCWHVCCRFSSSVFKFNRSGATTIQQCNVRNFSDLICHILSGAYHKPRYTFLRHIVGNNINSMEHILRVTDRNGQINRDST